MRLGDIIKAIAQKIAPLPDPPKDRKMSTPEDVRWMRRSSESIKRDAEMLGIDVRLEGRGR